jgi:hypothetical protein
MKSCAVQQPIFFSVDMNGFLLVEEKGVVMVCPVEQAGIPKQHNSGI